jgi:predicted PurR-regulated permease PerM
MRTRQGVLLGLVVVTGLLTAALLWSVVVTVFFAITVAYVLYPLRRMLVDRGLHRRVAAGVATSVAFVAVAALIVPPVWSLYRRRGTLLSYLRTLPTSLEFEVLGMPFAFEVGSLAASARTFVAEFAVDVAGAAPIIGLKLFLFTLLVYALLLRPTAAPEVVFQTVPQPYHDLVRTIHERVRDTLYAIYVLQGATALGTFLIAYVVFVGLGYPGAFGLAAVAGILQFIPVIGPSVLIALVATTDLVAGNVSGGITLLVIGLVFIGFLPDAIIRPQLAPYTADIPASLYFIGFTGGVLTVGIIGFIAGPLVIALLVEAVELLTDDRTPVQRELDYEADEV